MKNFKKFLKNTSISIIALALVPWTAVGAEPTILIDPNDNIPKTGTSQLHIVGAGLVPNSNIAITQVSTAPYSTLEGDAHNSGVKVERLHRGVLTVNASGVMDGYINVTYDPNSGAGGHPTINYCDTINEIRRTCVLEFRYTDPVEFIMQQNIYFGMSGPIVTPPPSTTPLTKDDCKDDKWGTFAAQGFKNQGACVSYVAGRQ